MVLRRVGCLVVVLVLASAYRHVKISVKVFRVYLGMVTCFWSTFVLGGGGNVTFHGIYVGSRGNYFIIGVSYAPMGHLRMWRVQLS